MPARYSKAVYGHSIPWWVYDLIIAADGPEFGDLDRNRLHLFGLQARHKLSGFLLGKAHQQHGGFADVGYRQGKMLADGKFGSLADGRQIRITPAGRHNPNASAREGRPRPSVANEFELTRRWTRRTSAGRKSSCWRRKLELNRFDFAGAAFCAMRIGGRNRTTWEGALWHGGNAGSESPPI